MTSGQERALALLKAQQEKVQARGPQWMVAEQLMDICRREPESAELISQDLGRTGMSITDAEWKIKSYADRHKTGNFACVTPIEAEEILRDMYKVNWPEGAREGGLGHGLPKAALIETAGTTGPAAGSLTVGLDLADFL